MDIVKTHKLIEHNFHLPTHDNELSKAEGNVESFKNKLKEIKSEGSIDDNLHVTMFEQIVQTLDYIGGLSMFAFEIKDEIEEMYKMKFLKSPELGKTLWLKHYEKIHQPYNKLKNRCHRLLEELDLEYERVFKKHPPNYKI